MISDPSRVRLRAMTPDDVDRVVEIANGMEQAPQWPRSVFVAMLDPGGVPKRIALVAEDSSSGAVVGFAVTSSVPPEAELESVAVIAEFQRHGVGSKLFEAVKSALRPAKVNQMTLEVRSSNRAAQRFYRSLGFVETGRRAAYYADPIEDATIMYLRGI
jgi:ribosomal-protein-alanine N-acetyltransferase